MIRIFKIPITRIFVKMVSFIMPLNINYRRTEIQIQNRLKNLIKVCKWRLNHIRYTLHNKHGELDFNVFFSIEIVI